MRHYGPLGAAFAIPGLAGGVTKTTRAAALILGPAAPSVERRAWPAQSLEQ
jgi:hypothetical protein